MFFQRQDTKPPSHPSVVIPRLDRDISLYKIPRSSRGMTRCGLGGLAAWRLIAAFTFALLVTFSAHATEKPVVKIGGVFPLTGDSAFMGEDMRAAMQIAADELNARPDNKYRYEVMFEDNALEAKKTALAVSKMISVDNIDALVSAFSHTGKVASVMAEQNKILHFGMAWDPDVAQGDYNFVHWPPIEKESDLLLQEMQRRGLKRLAIIGVNQSGFNAAGKVLHDHAAEYGIEVVYSDTFNFGQKDFRSQIAKAQAAKPDLWFPGAFSPELEIMTRQIREAGATEPLGGIETFLLGENRDIFEGQWFVNPVSPRSAFENAFVARMGRKTSYVGPNAYDAVYLVAWAFEHAPSRDREEIMKTFRTLHDFEGALGKLTLIDGDFLDSAVTVMEIRNGEAITVGE